MFRVTIEYVDDQDSDCNAKVTFRDDTLGCAIAKALSGIKVQNPLTCLVVADAICELNEHKALMLTNEPFEGYHKATSAMIQGAYDLAECWEEVINASDKEDDFDIMKSPPDPTMN